MSAPAVGLAALQARLQAHVLQGDMAALADVVGSPAFDEARRLGIYHHAYRARLQDTMRDTFGHTWRYLGDEWFDMLAGRFIEGHPSAHRNLRWYGRHWPAWLAHELQEGSALGAHPEVAELAQLDWCLRQAFDAADAPALCLQDLAAMQPEDWAGACLWPQASVALLSLRHNALALWHALDQEAEVPLAAPLPAPVGVLVWRRDERPHFRSVSELEDVALTHLLLGRSFADLCALLAERVTDLDAAAQAGAFLRRWVDDGVLARPSMVAGEAPGLALADHQA